MVGNILDVKIVYDVILKGHAKFKQYGALFTIKKGQCALFEICIESVLNIDFIPKQTRNCVENGPPFFCEWRTWPFVLTCHAFNCSQFGRCDCDGAQSAATPPRALHHDFTNCSKRWKSFTPCGWKRQLFPILTWNLKWVMFTLQAAHISDIRKSCFVKNKKRGFKKKSPERRRRRKKNSSTLAFLEVAWDIAREIPSDITRFYDRELPYETVHAWCSPV